MNPRLLLISIFCLLSIFMIQSAYARENWLSEQISGEIMKSVSSEIEKMLNDIPDQPFFIQKSSTRLAQITTMMVRVSDCVIRSVHGQEQAVIFFYDNNISNVDWVKYLPCANNKIKIPEIYESKEYSGTFSSQDLRIAVICRDKEFQEQIINLINNIDTDAIISSNVSRYREQL